MQICRTPKWNYVIDTSHALEYRNCHSIGVQWNVWDMGRWCVFTKVWECERISIFFILKCFLGQIIWKWEMCRCRILDHRLSFCTLALMDHDCHFGIKRLKECHSKHPKSVLESYGSQCSCLFRVYSGFITMFEL